jgi:hypothetical protein
MGSVGVTPCGTPAVRVKLLKTGADLVVSDLASLAKLRESFAPGEAIKRAKMNGDEEDATVRQRCALLAIRHCD